MDVISLGKATKAKKAIASLNARLGDDVTGEHATVKERIDALEAKDPKVTLYNRVSDIEANTHINLNKHNLQVNALLQKDQYRLTDLVFDDFADDSGIDPEQSSGYTFDAAGRKVTIAEGQAVAEVVTIPEALETMPYMVAVSQAANTQNEASYPVDLAQGNFLDAEVIEQKIRLKIAATQGQGHTDNIIPNMTSNTAPEGLVESSSQNGTGYAAYFAMNESNSYWSSLTGYPQWLSYQFTSPKIISKYGIQADTGESPTNWTFEGWDGLQWVILDSQVDNIIMSKGMIYFEINNITPYIKYRIHVTKTYSTTGRTRINKFEMMESAIQNLYSPSGIYETPVLDLGDNVKRLYKVESLLEVPGETSIDLFTATSTDGITFSEYLPLNSDGTIASPNGRYVKIKAVLTGDGKVKETVVHDFAEEEGSTFQENEMVVFDGAAKLKTQHTAPMEADTSFTGEGTLLRMAIDKSKFTRVGKVEVTS